ncbi:S-Ena type endospore appendage [Priestia flexa]|uniref:EGF-like domain-containing protein n=1 Tax=Priestia megaterium TaxID=1404 RepID=A0AAX6BTF5_PRIMG|nr:MULTISPECIES: S-Ena type endospore appendage [Bacilli]EGI2115058.1 hypothetical protein [Listeria monocytogenes]MDN4634333.1 hypothetical protein [Sphingomonas sp. PsM26]HES8074010.1 hypothetical protein [Streptococcus pyogenes]KLV29022.1 hypothetical protein ABW04_26600 [Priestia megaterium]KZB89740.1 hypothetical protein A2U94_19920 [Bacillus sp. VT 712]
MCICKNGYEGILNKCSNNQMFIAKKCVPFRSPCDGLTRTTIYTTSNVVNTSLANGIIAIVNTSIDCVMNVSITDSSGENTYVVSAQSSLVVQVFSLSLITVVCGPDNDNGEDFCTGTFEATLSF